MFRNTLSIRLGRGHAVIGFLILCGVLRAGSAAAQTALPFFDGFETGALSGAWSATSSTADGRIYVTTNGVPYNGSRHVVLDESSYDYALNELILSADLSGQSNVYFDCWVRSYYGVNHAMPIEFAGSTNADGIALSADGTNWHRLASFDSLPINTFSNVVVDLDQFASDRGLNLQGPVEIKFQQFGFYSLVLDGLSFDDVQLYARSAIADLVVSLDEVPSLVAIGSNLTYSILVSNAGPSVAESVVLTNRWSLPSTVVFVDGSRGTWTTNAASVVADLGDLAVGDTATVTVVVQPLGDGVLTNVTDACSSTLDIETVNNHQSVTTVVEQAGGDLAIGPALSFVDEDGGWVDLTVSRTGGLAGVVSIDYETVDGTAEAGSDFTAIAGTLFFSNGVAELQLSVPLLDDDLAESLESFSVRLVNPAGGAALSAPSNVLIQIRDEDGIAPAPFADGFESGVFSNYWATYTSRSIRPAVVTNDGPHGGSRHADMLGESWWTNALSELILSVDLSGWESATLRFWHKRFSSESERAMPAAFAGHVEADGVAISVDGTNWYKIHGLEDAETGEEQYRPFEVELDPILAAHGLDYGSHVRIKFQKYGLYVPGIFGRFFDDVAIVARAGDLRFAEPWEWEVAEGGGAITLAVERINGDVGEVSVQYATYAGTATANSDYTTTAGTLVFSNGVVQQSVVVPILQDGDDEDPSEQFTVQLFNPQGGAGLISPMQAVVSVVDDDGLGELGFGAEQYTAPENAAQAEISVLRRYGSEGEGSVRWRTQAGTATPGTDYVESTGTLTFAAGVVRQIGTIPLLDDADEEGAETIQIILYEPEGNVTLGMSSNAWLTLQDDEAPRADFPFYEGFESGVWSNGWTVHSTGAGRIQLANLTNGFEGDRSLTMDSTAGAALNEATLTVDLAGQSSVVFRCWTRDFADVAHAMPATFAGSVNADGIAVSVDGLNWHRLVDLAAWGRQAVYTNLAVDLAAFAAQRNLALTSTFQIRFQQYDTGAFPARGRSFDHISLTPASNPATEVIRAQGFEGGTGDAWGFKLMPMEGQIAIRPEREWSGSRSLRFAGSDSRNNGPFVEFDNVDFGDREDVFLSVAFSASGPDNDDDLYLDVSYDNGLTWTNSAKLVDGYGNANVPFGGTNATNPATVGTNPWTMGIPASESQIKVRLWYEEAVSGNNTNDFYFVDDVTLLYLPSNQPPVLDTIEDARVVVSNRLEFSVAATDIDLDEIALAVSNLPAGAAFDSTNGNGTFVWESAAPTGVYSVTFYATDKDGTDEEAMSITVAEADPELDPPVIQAASDVQVAQFNANWLASDGAAGYRLDVARSNAFLGSGRGSNLMVNSGFETGDSTGWDKFETEYAVVAADPQEGAYQAACTATATRSMMQPIAITGDGVTPYEVSFYYKKPVVTGSARIWATWASGGQVSGDSLQPTIYLPAASNWTQMTYVVVPQSGTNLLNFEVRTYSGASVGWDHFFVGTAGGDSSYVPGYENRDVGNVTTCVVTGLTDNATYYYRAMAYNATSNSPYSGTTNVLTVNIEDIPPILGAIANQSVTVDHPLQFQVSATPTDGDPVTLTASNLPSGSIFNSTNEVGTFLWTNAAPTGFYSVVFYATDDDGSDSATVGITVAAAPLLFPAPVIRPASSVQVEQFNANWLAVDEASGYWLDVGTNHTFTAGNHPLLASNAATSPSKLTNDWSGFAVGGSTYIQMTNWEAVITSAAFSAVGFTNLTVDFRARTFGGTIKSNITVSISTNNGVDWTVMGVVCPASGSTFSTVPTLTDTSHLGFAQTRIRWQSLDAGGGIGVGVSNLVVRGWDPVAGAPSYVPGYERFDAGDVTTCAVTGLTGGVRYYYRAMAYSAASNSLYSGTTNVVTLGTPPVLHAIGGQDVFLGRTLAFQVSATPTEADAVTLTASNLPAGATFHATNENGTFQWLSASPTGEYSVVFYAADNDGSDGAAVGIYVYPLPQVGGFAASNGAPAAATFRSVLGQAYRMEFSTDLHADPVVWTEADSEIGDGNDLTLSDTNAVDLMRYYRIVAP